MPTTEINFGLYNLKTIAEQSTDYVSLCDSETLSHLSVLAKAYAWEQTSAATLKNDVITACQAIMGTEVDPATGIRTTSLVLGKQLYAFVKAAEIVVLPEPLQTNFKSWLTSTISIINSEGRSLITSNKKKPSEWGIYPGASLIAIYKYLNDQTGINTVANVLRGLLGDRTAYTGFSYSTGATPWFHDINLNVAINPVGSTINIGGTPRSVDGCMTEGMRNYAPVYPFDKTDDPYTSLQGIICQATQLYDLGFTDVWEWSDKAILRAFTWQIEEAQYPPELDDFGMIFVINNFYGTNYPLPRIARIGKIDAFYDYKYGITPIFQEPDFSKLAKGLWVDRNQLSTLPKENAAYTALYNRATAVTWPAPAIWDLNATGEQYAIAAAMVFCATGNIALRDRVVLFCLNAIDTDVMPDGNRSGSLGISRNLLGLLIAADLIELQSVITEEQLTSFNNWVRRAIYTINNEGRSVVMSNYTRPNNWGIMATSSLLAAFYWLNEPDNFQIVAAIFKGYLGDYDLYSDFTYRIDMSWHENENRKVGVNPIGAKKRWDNPYDQSMIGQYVNIDGILPEEMRRWDGVEFIFPPPQEQYVWEALQGIVASAEILYRAGYPSWDWEDKAIARAVSWVYHEPVSFNNTVWAMGTANYVINISTNYEYLAARNSEVVLRFKNKVGNIVTESIFLHQTDSTIPVYGVIECSELLEISLAWSIDSTSSSLKIYAGTLECTIISPIIAGTHISKKGYPPDGDDLWQVWVLNKRTNSVYKTTTPTIPGKQIGFTDWTHGIYRNPIISLIQT